MKIAIIGAGAMGTMFGAFLGKAGEDVCMIDVRKDHIEAISEKGIIVKYPDKEEAIPAKGALTSDEAAKLFGGPADVVMIFTKTPMNKMVLDQAGALIGPDTYLMTTQNGLGSEEQLAEYVARDHVIVGTTALNAMLGEPGTINYRFLDAWSTYIMPLEGDMNEMTEKIAKALTDGGQPTYADMNTEKIRWKKIAVNCMANSASALTRLKSNIIFDNEYGRAYADLILKEVVAVANAKGIEMTREELEPQVDVSAKLPAYPSMGLDAVNHRITEIGTLNGSIVKLGREYGIDTPANAVMYNLVSILHNNYDQLPESQDK